ncbi:MAG: histidine phosphatase family protein [Candidatus Micrarchaeota archaeon]
MAIALPIAEPRVESRTRTARLHLVRHGETQANREMLFPGTNARLTGNGIAQARKVGTEFLTKEILVDTILVSPTKRTFETLGYAFEVIENSSLVFPVKPRVIVVQELLEKDPGGAVGKRIPETWGEIDRVSVKAGGESLPQFIERVENAAVKLIREIEAGKLGNEVALFGHSLVNRIILGVFQGIGGARGLSGKSQINGGIKTVEIELV